LVLVLVLVIGPIRRIRPIGRSGQVQGIRSKTGTVTISPYRLVCPFALYPSQRHGLSGEGFDGKWWLPPFSTAMKGFFASLRMTLLGSAAGRLGRLSFVILHS